MEGSHYWGGVRLGMFEPDGYKDGHTTGAVEVCRSILSCHPGVEEHALKKGKLMGLSVFRQEQETAHCVIYISHPNVI